jgi:hypothetical protein
MACDRCGGSKGNLDPIEWLGSRCPAPIRKATLEVWAALGFAPEPSTRRVTVPATVPLIPKFPPPRRRIPGPGGPGGRTLRIRRPDDPA